MLVAATLTIFPPPGISPKEHSLLFRMEVIGDNFYGDYMFKEFGKMNLSLPAGKYILRISAVIDGVESYYVEKAITVGRRNLPAFPEEKVAGQLGSPDMVVLERKPYEGGCHYIVAVPSRAVRFYLRQLSLLTKVSVSLDGAPFYEVTGDYFEVDGSVREVFVRFKNILSGKRKDYVFTFMRDDKPPYLEMNFVGRWRSYKGVIYLLPETRIVINSRDDISGVREVKIFIPGRKISYVSPLPAGELLDSIGFGVPVKIKCVVSDRVGNLKVFYFKMAVVRSL